MKSVNEYETHNLTVRYGTGYNNQTPAILIQGKYLQKYGLPIGTKITVDCWEGEIVIKADTPAKKEQTFLSRLIDYEGNQLDFERWNDKDYKKVISKSKELYRNPLFADKIAETVQFIIEDANGNKVYESDNSIFKK